MMFDKPPEDNISKLEEVFFSCIDKDGDGKITANEFGTFLRSVDLTPLQAKVVEDIMNEIDADYEGVLRFPEFLSMIYRTAPDLPDSEEEIKEAFKVFDRDGDGYISEADLRHVMTNLGDKLVLTDEEVQEIICEFDGDGDGRISLDEFSKMMQAY